MAGTSQTSKLTEALMVKGMRKHYNEKEEGLSQVKVQVDIIWSTIQKRFQHLHAGDKENAGEPVLGPDDKEQFVYLNQQLSQLTDNLRSLVSDENQEQRHLDYIKAYYQQCSKEDNSNFVAAIQDLESMHSANCSETEEIENHINRAIRHLSKITKTLNGEGQGKMNQCKVTCSKQVTKMSGLRERNQ
ncbi:uncharacterized protein LOC125666634 [Ostrea edulis]|uniref:uncharacterized protein LOC125666634 n=1 Tax=Ostrea edulis TaxID=37623 RepID=UPI002094ADD3|nr:uncharacterized protein LOC125666634 [Ostrea edulis]